MSDFTPNREGGPSKCSKNSTYPFNINNNRMTNDEAVGSKLAASKKCTRGCRP